MINSNELRLTDIGYINSLMKRYGLQFDKRLGQNFLVNPKVPARIADECNIVPGCGILEIGPGIGTLTVELAKRFTKVTAVELDQKLIPILDKTLAGYKNTEVLNADIMSVDIAELANKHFSGMKIAVCANLPYCITSPVIIKLLESRVDFCFLTLMVQREFAAKLCAQPSSPQYAAITAEVAWFCGVKRLFGVSAGSFIPIPKVESAVIKLEPQPPPSDAVSYDEYRKVVSAAFARRRKTLGNALSSEYDKNEVVRRLQSVNIDPNRRGETLSPKEFAKAAFALRGI